VTEDYVRQRLAAAGKRASPAEIEAKARRFVADLAGKKVAPPPPLSQPVESARDPVYGLGVHPDLIQQLWTLERSLPQSCRWLVWGHPSLVHPQTGVIFAVGIGTIGIAGRLPPELRDESRPETSARDYDVSPAGPEWRFPAWAPRLAQGAYAFAAASD
jgi:hypothetical protein